jgi:hypothetical protein
MKKIFIMASLFTLFAWGMAACGKSGGGGGGGTTEAKLAANLTPAVGSVQAPALGPDFNVQVSITSTLPTNGVKVEVTAKPEAGGAAFYSTQNNVTTAASNYTITGTPINVASIVEVKLTSLTQASNTWTGSYRYSRK